MLLRADLKLSDPATAERLSKSNEEDKLVIIAGTALEYSSEYFPDTSFSVTATHRISKERAETVAYDFSSQESEKK